MKRFAPLAAFLIAPLASDGAAAHSRALPASCAWLAPNPSQNHYYDGRIGTAERVRAVLSFTGCSVRGTWFDSIDFKDHAIDGTVRRDGAAELAIRDPRGAVLGYVRGEFGSDQPDSDRMVGRLVPGNRAAAGPVELQLQLVWSGDNAKVDESARISDRNAFDRALMAFWMAVREQDRSAVLAAIHFPLSVDSGEQTGIHIFRTPAELVDNYQQVFSEQRRSEILDHLPVHLGQGYWSGTVALADQVLFDAQGRVVCLGPCTSPVTRTHGTP